ncbi:uncharacterized protein K452DRAFT_350718 [Aplosporella prunicola CBS 121167]|uniref:AMP-dependent synthetase/ligase domain-containing protein n=1 Tax=Aplosporella prunicola CBS 121167 TaxID=1176127 RepID=A0A6A6BIF5_9PEZI|nr:uncharacterized protein K452DRAFT_350718 [Aplosporella prunicola CBS 121167]KAF2143095.1 hypothetical protein K452DRAFT_350718 [Aplosporella prunicola CBS 121167]
MTTTSAFYEDTILPEKRQSRLMRHARHTFLNVYRRLFSIVFIANVVGFVWITVDHHTLNLPVEALATAASANICVAILIRQEYIVNLLYAACLAVPPVAPLRLRRQLAKVYENGGIHSGAAIASTLWFALLTIVITYQFVKGEIILHSGAVLAITYILIAFLVMIVFFAYPAMRNLTHNTFEFTHRFAGWTAIGIFWVDLILLAFNTHYTTGTPVGLIIVRMPTLWFLIIITFHLALPWVRLRKVKFEAQNLSNHAVRLNFKEKLAPIRGVALSTSPFGQYHSFATFPNTAAQESDSQSIIVSSAGDWTKAQVGDESTERHYWMRGIPKIGVLGIATIFKSVVIVTTGSGIGPCLAFINLPENLRRPCRVLWSTPRPEMVYGQEICNMVLAADPEAIIWDSKVGGRPDMVKMTYELFTQSGAEAVFVISNPMLTRKLVFGLESRGVPAFGPIWDS